MLLNKFLHHRSLKGFRVVALESGVLEVRRLREREEKAEPEGNPPPPSVSVPYYFPQSNKDALLFPAQKRSRKKS